ncbi:hypothetical protein [Achromobacter sp.]|uniref:hypothetical protein n=1 Tax=Achromobacter sp. TaxID=134375 RepID=UPI0028AB573C|nr:hypothetical protein [Achromobacter sp.]
MQLTKTEWMERCQRHYMTKAGLTESQAADYVEWCWNNREDGETPEDAADADMSCWEP